MRLERRFTSSFMGVPVLGVHSGFSRRVCSLINCNFAGLGVLPEAFYLGFADETFARALEGVLMRVSLRLTALVRLWCCVCSPEKPGDRPRSSVERTF